MMRKKQKRNLIIILSVIFVLIIIAVYIVIYIKTDMFKSNKTLFIKYLGKNVENLETVIETIDYGEVTDNAYRESSEIEVSYVNGIGTTSENTDNAINKLKVAIDEKADKSNNYYYKNFKLLNNNEDAMNLEYVQSDNNYGIRFIELFQQFLSAGRDNVDNILKKTDLSESQIEKAKKLLAEKPEIKEKLKFNEEEIEILKNKYAQIVGNEFSNKNFEKIKNQQITINGSPVYVNVYSLTISKEKLNNIYIKILQTIKEDEFVTTRLSYIQEAIDKLNVFYDKPIDIQNIFSTKIDEMIGKINKNNIGNEETKIIVYENAKRTVRTSFVGADYQIDIDTFRGDDVFAEISINGTDKNVIKKITMESDSKKQKISIENNENREPYTIGIQNDKTIVDSGTTNNINIRYEISNYRIETDITKKIRTLTNVEDKIILDNRNTIQLDSLNEQNLSNVLGVIEGSLKEKMEALKSQINLEELKEVKVKLGMLQNTNRLTEEGEITEAEKNRFNSKFQFINIGEELDNKSMLETIDIFKDNIINLEVPSNTEIKVLVDPYENNEQSIETLKNYIEENERQKYTISVEYNEQTGLVNFILITIISDR